MPCFAAVCASRSLSWGERRGDNFMQPLQLLSTRKVVLNFGRNASCVCFHVYKYMSIILEFIITCHV